jgi:hypothetical protein
MAPTLCDAGRSQLRDVLFLEVICGCRYLKSHNFVFESKKTTEKYSRTSGFILEIAGDARTEEFWLLVLLKKDHDG